MNVLRTHEAVNLASGFVMDHVIECSWQNGQFNTRRGKAEHARFRDDHSACRTREEGGAYPCR